MRRLRYAGLALSLLLPLMLLPGCWNSRDIQNMAYITAIGLDYEDGNYIAYSQVMNFENIARSENQQVGGNVPLWVGKSSGRTITEAIDSLSSTSQLRLFWGHVKVLVCTERILRLGARNAYDALNRYREIRYNVFVYATKEKLEDILTMHSLLNLSPLDSVMFSPNTAYRQNSPVLPVSGNRFIASINEPGDPGMLPTIGINRKAWRESKDPMAMFVLTGAYFFHNRTLQGWMSQDELRGARWTNPKIARADMGLPDEQHPKAALILSRPQYTVHPSIVGGEARFRVEVKVKGFLNEMYQEYPTRELERMAEETIVSELKDVYLAGVAKKCDVLRLQCELYRKHPREWKRLAGNGEWILNPSSLAEVKAHVELENTGKYKGRPG